MNTDLLLKVKEQILREPKQFIMSHYFQDANQFGDTPPNCGTAACIAGWALSIAGNVTPKEEARRGSYHLRARTLLDLDYDHAEELFDTAYWPTTFRSRYCNASTQEELAQIAADRIDAFIEEYAQNE